MTNYKLPCEECYPPHPEPHYHPKKEVELVCGTGSGVSLPIINFDGPIGGGYHGFTPLVVATVNINTRDLADITKKIDFSSIISFQATNLFSFLLVFQLSAVCNGGYKTPLGTWTYEKSIGLDFDTVARQLDGIGLDFKFNDPFAFTWCECGECPECCRFIVEVIDFRHCGVNSASINNVGISVLAAGFPHK